MLRHSDMLNKNNLVNRMVSTGDTLPKFLTYQLDGRVFSYRGNDG